MMKTPDFAATLTVCALTAMASGCGSKSAPSVCSLDPGLNVAPATSDGLDAWITAQPWTNWTCEPAPRPARLNSPHGDVRVCENALLASVPANAEPACGATAVKEMYYGGSIWAVAIAVHGRPGHGGDAWFWWRKVLDGSASPSITNASFGDGFCTGCHDGAANQGGRDVIFTPVP